jgi:Histidine-specific methyltransferase, SAM-dependent
MVELGAGSLRKSIHIVRALANVPSDDAAAAVVGGNTPKVIYHALDLDKNELIRTLEDMKKQEGKQADQDTPTVSNRQVGLNGLWATYDQGE